MLLKNITAEEVLEYIGINYEGVLEEIERLATTCTGYQEFFNEFEKYYDEHGLGGDDRWLDCKSYLPIMVKFNHR